MFRCTANVDTKDLKKYDILVKGEKELKYGLSIVVSLSLFVLLAQSTVDWLHPVYAKAEEGVRNDQTVYGQLWTDESDSKSVLPSGVNHTTVLSHGTTLYQDHAMGFSFDFPSNWSLDDHEPNVYARIFTNFGRVDVTYQDLQTTPAYPTLSSYLKVSTNSILPYTYRKEDFLFDGKRIMEYDYKRQSLFAVDLTYYGLFFWLSDHNVYTLQLKTSPALFERYRKQVLFLIASIKNTTVMPFHLMPSGYTSPPMVLNGNRANVVIPTHQLIFGVNDNNIKQTEQTLHYHFGMQMVYEFVDDTYDPQITQMVDNGTIPMISYHFYDFSSKTPQLAMQRLLSGDYNANLLSWANGLKTLPSPVLFRIGNEMNGSWSQWSLGYNYDDPDLYTLAYRYIVHFFQSHGVHNVYYVWNPNGGSAPGVNWNNPVKFYPGDAYVNFVGMTNYNWGLKIWGGYPSFNTLFSQLYATYQDEFADKPLVIGEFAASAKGGSMANFADQMFQSLPNYPNLKAIIWLNAETQGFDFFMDHSLRSTEAFQKGLLSPYIIEYPLGSSASH